MKQENRCCPKCREMEHPHAIRPACGDVNCPCHTPSTPENFLYGKPISQTTQEERDEYNETGIETAFPMPNLHPSISEKIEKDWESVRVNLIDDIRQALLKAEQRGREAERREVREMIETLKKVSDSNTYLYGQGESHAYRTILSLLKAKE